MSLSSATRMLAMIVILWLCANALQLFLTMCEYFVDIYELCTEYPLLRMIYSLSADLISLLTIAAGGGRIIIYTSCNAKIKNEVKSLFIPL